jgi:sialidase-1
MKSNVSIYFRPWQFASWLPIFPWARLALLGLLAPLTFSAEPSRPAAVIDALEPIDLFKSGAEGYHTFRIPVMVVSDKGTVMAFCEGRKNGIGDHGEIHLIVKRSFDRGKSWGPVQVICREPGNVTIGNPAPVMDVEASRLVLAFCRNNKSVFISTSADDGATWAAPRDITRNVRLPGWDWYATGPSPGIQLRHVNRGRLVIPCNHSVRPKDASINRAHVIYSDDHGTTWKLGQGVPLPTGHGDLQTQLDRMERDFRLNALGTDAAVPPEPDKTPRGLAREQNLIYAGNEACVVELSDGSLLMNTRGSILGTTPMRAISTSRDGGVSWEPLTFVPALVEPGCHADLRAVITAKGKSILLFSNPAHPPVPNWDKGRQAMTVRASLDGGKSWPFQKLLHAGPSSYSSVLLLDDDTVLCLFEGGASHRREWMRLVRFPLSELLSP